MNARGAWWLAWMVGALTSAVAAAQLVLVIVDPAPSDQSNASDVPSPWVAVATFETVVLIALAIIGSVVASRQPRNAVGWVLCVIPLSLGVLILGSYTYWSLTFHEAGEDGLAVFVAWLASWTWVPAVIPTVTLFPLLFPTGRPPTPRWRPVVWLAGMTIVLMLFTELFRPGRLQEYPVDNPVGAGAAVALVVPIGDVLWLITTIASLASLVVRFRRSHGDERQQVKWVASGAVLFVATFALSPLTQDMVGEDASFAIILLGWLFIASGVAVAMLRYRLYDIDLVINRALVYGALTAMLAGTYLGSVLLLQLALRTFTEGSGLAVAASTLATAALFRPLRARIQAVVDRRFFRRKYDAAQTLQAFGGRLRDQVDLGELDSDLRAVVSEALQPAHITLWLRERSS